MAEPPVAVKVDGEWFVSTSEMRRRVNWMRSLAVALIVVAAAVGAIAGAAAGCLVWGTP